LYLPWPSRLSAKSICVSLVCLLIFAVLDFICHPREGGDPSLKVRVLLAQVILDVVAHAGFQRHKRRDLLSLHPAHVGLRAVLVLGSKPLPPLDISDARPPTQCVEHSPSPVMRCTGQA